MSPKQLYRPDLKYSQGLPRIATFLLLLFEPFEAFKMLSNLALGSRFASEVFLDQTTITSNKLRQLASCCLQTFQPALFNTFLSKGICGWELLLEEWILSMFVGEFSITHCMALWDLTLSRGLEVFVGVFLVVFGMLEGLGGATEFGRWREIVHTLAVTRADEIIKRLLDGGYHKATFPSVERLVRSHLESD